MATYKKSEIKLAELVDADGSPIEGNEKWTRDEIKTANQQTTGAFAKATSQGPRYYGSYGGSYVKPQQYESKEKIKEIVEDFLSKKRYSDIVKRALNRNINTKELPNITEVKDANVTSITKDYADKLASLNLVGEELAIILNYLFDKVDINKIPDEYKQLLINKIK